MAYGQHTPEVIELDRVFLDTANPRHQPKDNQPQVIEELVEKEQAVNLAEDIAAHGLNPVELFALYSTDKGKTFIAAEGNRRLCALMLLNDPQRAPAKYRKRLERAAKNWSPVRQIYGVVFDDLEAVRPWRDRIHGGPDEGRGRRTWDAEQKARNTPFSKNNFAQAVLDFAQKKNLITESERKGRISTVQKYLTNPAMREAVGLVGTDENALKTNLPDSDFAKVFGRFIRDVADKEIDTRSGQKADDIEKYARKIRKEVLLSGKTTPPRALGSVKNAGFKARAKKTRIRRPTAPRRIANDSVLQDALIKLKSYKLRLLYHSLTAIDLQSHTPLLTVAAWAFIETLTRAHGSNTDFFAYLSKARLDQLGFVTREEKASIGQALKRIAEAGNTTKHDSKAAAFNSEQLANDFEVLTPLLTKLAQEAK